MKNRQYNSSFERMNQKMKLFQTLFLIFWVLMLLVILGSWVLGAYLEYECYKTRDLNSFACWYVSDRVEVGVRQR
jgi:hypothetical protein